MWRLIAVFILLSTSVFGQYGSYVDVGYNILNSNPRFTDGIRATIAARAIFNKVPNNELHSQMTVDLTYFSWYNDKENRKVYNTGTSLSYMVGNEDWFSLGPRVSYFWTTKSLLATARLELYPLDKPFWINMDMLDVMFYFELGAIKDLDTAQLPTALLSTGIGIIYHID